MVNKRIMLDITEKTPLGYLYAKQGDINSRTLEIQLLHGGVKYKIPDGAAAKFRLRKPDKTQIMNNAAIKDDVITAELTEQCLAVEGVAVAEVGLYGTDGSLLTSETFMIKIVSSAVNDGEIKSSDEFGTLAEALVKVESAEELAEMARDAADEALETVTQMEAAELQRVNAEAARVEAETARKNNENSRATAENTRETNETSRKNAESSRVSAENKRETEENTRKTNENARTSAETKRAEAENARDTAEKDRATAEENRGTAEENRVNAETERAKAEKDRTDAEAARVEAETARANAFEEMREHTVKRYGARRVIGASSPTLERIWDAVGLTANVGVDSTIVVNDFDNIYPWSHVRTCNIEVVDGEIRVKAYEGEPTFARDGSNGNVAVEFPEFYSCPPYMNNDGYEYFGVSEYPIGGWNKHEKAYYAAYTAGTVDNKLVSISGVFPTIQMGRALFRTRARTTDELCGLIDLQYHDALSVLFTVEFATLNSQSKMSGATSLSYTNTEDVRAQITELGTNRIVLLNDTANDLAIGQTIAIGQSAYGRTVNNRRVMSIETYDSTTKAVYFDGDSVNITVGDYVSSCGWITGATDDVAASSGSIVSNTSGKYPCKYRGIENPWGNIWQWIDGVNIKDYQAYVCTDRAAYADNTYDGDYIALNYVNSATDGYIKEHGYDKRYPWARLPVGVGGSSSTFHCDMYYRNTGERALFFGGRYSGDGVAGLCCFSANAPEANPTSFLGARICWRVPTATKEL